MNTATTISKMLLFTGALTLCIMGSTKFVYAESNGAGDGNANDDAKYVYLVESDIAEGDDNWRELPMSVPDVPETPQENQEFQGYESGA